MYIGFINKTYAFYMEVLKSLMDNGMSYFEAVTSYLNSHPINNEKSYI